MSLRFGTSFWWVLVLEQWSNSKKSASIMSNSRWSLRRSRTFLYMASGITSTRSPGFASGDFIFNPVTAGSGMLEIGPRLPPLLLARCPIQHAYIIARRHVITPDFQGGTASKTKRGKGKILTNVLTHLVYTNIGSVRLLVRNPSHPRSEAGNERLNLPKGDDLGEGKRG